MFDSTAEAVQRAGVFAELPPLLRELGLEPAEVFEGSNIAPDDLSPDTRVRFESALRVLHAAAARARCPHLGLLLGSRFRLSHHGVLGRLMATAATLRQAVNDFVTWQPGYSSGAVVYLARSDDVFGIGYGVQAPALLGRRQLYDTVAAVGVRMVSELTGGAAAKRVELCYDEPVDEALYRRLLKTPIVFGSVRTCIIVGENVMNAPLPGADPVERMRILGDIETALTDSARRTSMLLQRVLRPLLQAGLPSMEDAAGQMGLHPRTLRRRLAAEGATFEEIRDATRFAIARELLEMTDLPVSQVAMSVAYASPGVFTDAFRRWSGQSPSNWRARGRSQAGVGERG